MVMFFRYKSMAIFLFIKLLLILANLCCCTVDNDEGQNGSQKYRVDGTVSVPFTADQSWTANTRVIVDGGHRLAFLRLELIDCHYCALSNLSLILRPRHKHEYYKFGFRRSCLKPGPAQKNPAATA